MKVLINALIIASLSIFIVNCASSGGSSKSSKKTYKKKSMKSKGGKSMGSSTCELKKDKRVLEIESTASGCVLYYTKFGEQKEAASGKWGKTHCEKIKDRIVGNLEEAGFNCN